MQMRYAAADSAIRTKNADALCRRGLRDPRGTLAKLDEERWRSVRRRQAQRWRRGACVGADMKAEVEPALLRAYGRGRRDMSLYNAERCVHVEPMRVADTDRD